MCHKGLLIRQVFVVPAAFSMERRAGGEERGEERRRERRERREERKGK